MAGRVIYLNGTSSAGKTSIALALQDVLDETFIRVGVDTFITMLPRKMFATPTFEPAPGGGLRPVASFRDAVRRPMAGALAAMASTSDLIVDDVVNGDEWLRSVVQALAPFTVLFVGVICPLEELERRESARGNRQVGVARGGLALAHKQGLYDLTVDTSVMTSAECAEVIKQRLIAGPPLTAFAELRARL
ncbi:MAG: chloramphenicol phosphotransferase CPT family protein [Chloroflexota bacterium]|nr:chloramphenicol phosphotransferase CPT family protein [Chloroflexota bacterium]